MKPVIDACGLSCPQPVLMTLREIRGLQRGEITVLVDTASSRENVIRAATAEGWEARDVAEDGDVCRITLVKA